MENPKTPETLAENPFDKSFQEAFGDTGLFGLNEDCTGSVFVSEAEFAVGENGGRVGLDNDGISGNNVVVGGVVEDGYNVDVVEGEYVGVGVDKTAGGEENCTNVGATEIGFLVGNGVGTETQMQACVTESEFGGRSLLANHENGEKRVERADSVEEMGLFGDDKSKEFGVKNVEDEGMEVENVMHLNGTDSATQVDIRDDGISLVVEVYCPPARDIQGNLDEANSLETTACKESLVMPDTESNGHIEEAEASVGQGKEEGVIDSLKSSYSMGDLVWVATKKESWWPGNICDPLDAPKYAAKSHGTDYLFVRYFGNGNFAWCSPAQLKHFHENFEQMSTKNKSKSFIVALEKAVGQFSRQLKSEMTCSCNLQESLSSHACQLSGHAKVNKGLSVSQQKSCEYSVTRFEPSGFLAHLKNLAEVGFMPTKLEFAVVQSRLWAYYCSIGHIQMPLRQLRDFDGQRLNEEDSLSTYEKEKEDTGNLSGGVMDVVAGDYKNSIAEGAISSKQVVESSKRTRQDTEVGNGSDEAGGLELASPSNEGTGLSRIRTTAEGKVFSDGNGDGETDENAEMGSESRERKKSKYLSPPYTDLNWGRKGFPESEAEDSKISKVSCEGMVVVKCSGKKSQKKGSRKPIDASKCLEVTNTSSANLLFELQMAALDCHYPNENKCFDSIEILFSMFRRSVYHNESNFGISSKNIVGQREVLDPSEANLDASRAYVVGNDDKTGSSGLSSPKIIAEQKRKKTNGKNTASCPFVLDSQVTGSPAPDVNPQQKKRKKKEGTTPASLPTNGTTARIPDLNGNSVMLSFALENSPVMSHVFSESKPGPKKRKRKEGTKLERSNNSSTASAGFTNLDGNNVKPISLVVDLHIGPQLNKDGKETATSVGVNTTLGAGLPEVNGNIMSEEKGLQGKETATSVSLNTNLGAVLPDVNGSIMSEEKGLQGKETATSVSLNTNLGAGLPDVNGSSVLQQGLLSFEGKSEPKKRKKKVKAMIDSPKSTFGIPDLNGNVAEAGLLGKDSPEVKPERKRRRKGEGASGTKDPNLKSSRVGINREALGTTLLLTFAPGNPMPSKDVLIATFSRFESLRELETLVFEDSSSAQVVFATNSDSVEAVKYLETSNPFGPALVNYQFQHLSASSGVLEPDRNLRIPPIHPVDGVKTSATLMPQSNPVGDAPPLSIVRQNLEIMTAMLAKSGDKLSADMKAKLEADIKSLLKKVSTMAGCSSS